MLIGSLRARGALPLWSALTPPPTPGLPLALMAMSSPTICSRSFSQCTCNGVCVIQPRGGRGSTARPEIRWSRHVAPLLPPRSLHLSSVAKKEAGPMLHNRDLPPKSSVSEKFGASESSHTCWSCGKNAPIGSFFCDQCDVVLASCGRSTYFGYFGSPVTFDVDVNFLQSKYRDIQRKLHPDKFHQKSEREQRFSRDQSASLNTAYTVLTDPLLRAQYLLKLQGEDVLQEGKTLLDPEELMAVLEAREEVEAAEATPPLEALRTRTKEEQASLVNSLSEDFSRQDQAEAKRHTIKLQYLTKLLEEIENKLSLLEA